MGELTIEQMQQIVSDAPENSQVVIPCSDGVMYFAQREDGKWFRYSDGYQKWLEYFGKCDPMDLAIKLSDLKAQIDQHYYGQSEEKELEQYADLTGINELTECLQTPDLSEVRKEELAQDWKGMDGACAFSLIERHADNWKEIGYMMQMWLDTNQQDLKAQLECCRKENAVLLGKVGELQGQLKTWKGQSMSAMIHGTCSCGEPWNRVISDREGFSLLHCFNCNNNRYENKEYFGDHEPKTLRGAND